MRFFRMFALVLTLAFAHSHGKAACANDDSISLLQAGVAVQMRGHEDVSKRSPHADLELVQRSEGASGIEEESAAEAEPLSAPASGVAVETGYEIYHATTTTKPHEHTTPQVLVSCVSVITLLVVGWSAYWIITSQGYEEIPVAKLALLMGSFGVCSWGMNVVNKSLVTSLGTPTLVTGAQMLMTVLATLIVGRHKFSGRIDEVAKWCIIPFIFFSMLVSSFFTYRYLTLSMLMLVRNLGPMITLPIETVVMPADKRPYVTMPMLMALSVILGSTFVYCQKIEVRLEGILLAVLNMGLAIADRVAQRRLLTTECQGLSTETCVFLNNFVGLVPTCAMALITGEFAKVDAGKFFFSMTTVLLVLSGIIGTGICYFALAVQREISATSFMVLQNMVRMAVVATGVLVFLDPIGWPWQVIGLGMSFLGALWYGDALPRGVCPLRHCPTVLCPMPKRSRKGPRSSPYTMSGKSQADREAKEFAAKAEVAAEGGPHETVLKSISSKKQEGRGASLRGA